VAVRIVVSIIGKADSGSSSRELEILNTYGILFILLNIGGPVAGAETPVSIQLRATNPA